MGILNDIYNSQLKEFHSEGPDGFEELSTWELRKKYKQIENEGGIISWWDYEKSIDLGWPYPVATEFEYNQLGHSDHQAIRGHAPDIANVIEMYVNGRGEDTENSEYIVYKDHVKAEFWKRRIILGAEGGNLTFQAVLIARNAMGRLLKSVISDQEFELYEQLYREALVRKAELGDPEAQYAISLFCGVGDIKYLSDKHFYYAENAMKSGLTDAIYLYSNMISNKSLIENHPIKYDEEIQYYLKAVDNSSGAMLGFMQERVADAYNYGEDGLLKNKEKAEHYYKLALSHGSDSADYKLEHLFDY